MKSFDSRATSPPSDTDLRMEAAEWLLGMEETTPDLQDPYANPEERNRAFLEWVSRSSQHLKIFLEIVETHRRLPMIDRQCLINVEQLLAQREADIIHLPGKKDLTVQPAFLRTKSEAKKNSRVLHRQALLGVAASVAMLGMAIFLYWIWPSADTYTTAVGEQRQAKLEDGSFVYLNTDSRVEVDFTETARNIQLVRGEALFVVEKDSQRPFVVSTGTAKVRAVGTQFNVRRLVSGTDVAVIEGVVHVAAVGQDNQALAAPAAIEVASATGQKQLKAGEGARVARGEVVSRGSGAGATVDPIAWRQRRLVFYETKLVDVADEFNRYNRTKIQIKGDAAQEILLTGIFDADRPHVLMLYAAKNDALAVEPDGKNWVIRAR